MVTQPLSQSDFDPSSMVKLYLGALESWKKNYENLVSSMAEASPLPAASSTEHSAAANGQDVAVQLFQKVVEAEMELCRFYEKRWSSVFEAASSNSQLQITHGACRISEQLLQQIYCRLR